MNTRKHAGQSFALNLTAVAVAACFSAEVALANPTGPSAVTGVAAINGVGTSAVTVDTSAARSIINWQTFSIGTGELTRFNQPNTLAAVLNRVVGSGGPIDPSLILGTLSSNGRIYLINPSGITFGASSVIDVAGLVASSLGLSNTDFLAGVHRFTPVPGAGAIVNEGSISTAASGPGGNVYLVGPAVTNGGFITSPQGEVILAAGNSVELVDPGTPNLRVEIVAPANQAANLGTIIADSGRIGIYAGLINQSGNLQANTVAAMPDGRIVLKATNSTTLAAGSQTMATLSPGASVEIETGDLTVNGSVTSGTQSIVATGNMTVAATTGNAQVVANGQQTVNVGGTLTVQGAGSGSNRAASLNSSGDQNVTAGNIVINGGTGGSNNSAEIRHRGGGDQTVTVTGGGTLAIHGGATGTGNRARLRNEVGDQAIDVTGGAIMISGGGSGPADSGNSARIEGAGSGMQTVDAHTITILGGIEGTDNFSGIQAAHQAITTTGDVTLIGGGGSVTGARIGSFGTGAPTDLHLQVGGDLTLIGGSTTDANIGSNRFGNAQTDIVAEVGGDITLTPGATPGADARIGSPDGLVAGGNIALKAGGDITMNSTPGIGSSIRTLGDVSLQANAITQGSDAVIQADQLSVNSIFGATLVGANQVSGFDATGGSISGVTLNNASPLLTVTGISTFGGPLAMNQAGNMLIQGNVFTGAQHIQATGDITVTPGPVGNVAVSASGPQSVNAGGSLNILGAPDGASRFAQLVSRGEQTITAADINITGGTGANNFAQIIHQSGSTGNQAITVTGGGSLTIQGGATGDDNFARIRNDVGNQSVNVAGGAIAIGGGGTNPTDDGGFARIESRSSGLQSIGAHTIAITGGAGLNSSPGIQGAHQNISTTGDVTIIGGTGSVTGSRIGAYGTGNPTDLVLNVGGNLTMSGGPETDATLGSNRFGNARTDMAVNVAGNITLNPGGSPGADVRIGSPEGLVGDGNISLSAGGNIALNSMPGAGAEVRTLGNVSLHGNAITQGTDAVIQADQLSVNSTFGGTLVGVNQVSGFSATGGFNGVWLNNMSPLLTVNGINTSGGPLTIQQAGNLAVRGNVTSGGQIIAASGDMTVDATNGGVRINAFADQAVNVGGTLTLKGGSSGSDRSARITSNGRQNVTAGNIVMNGGTGGSNNFAEIRKFNNADQNITVTGGGTLAITGGPATGTDNFARIRNDGGNQRISVPGGQIVIAGGAGPDGPPDLTDTANNFARIEGRNGTVQTVDAHSIAVYGGTSGSYNFSGIQSEYQNINTTGDVTIVGGGGYVTGARIGGIADGPTNLQINVGGNLTLTGGTETDASLGSNREGGYRTDITVFANGNVTLNPGMNPGADARIGSPEVNVAGGNIALIAPGGNITLNSAPGAGASVIRTLGNVSLQSNAISQGPDAVIQADQLFAGSNTGTYLAGANQVSGFTAYSNTGDVELNNASPLLTVHSINAFNGPLDLRQEGDLLIQGNVSTGTQDIQATGNITVTPGPVGNVAVFASGPQSVSAGGSLNIVGAPEGANRFAQITTLGNQTISADSIELAGGGGTGNFALILHQSAAAGNQSITVNGGNMTLTGGIAGANNQAMVRQMSPTGSQMITLNGGGAVNLQGGPGGTNNFAQMRNDGFAQGIQFTPGGTLTLTGGSGAANDYAQITANNGSQTISGLPSITLTGGTNGVADQGNRAQIRAPLGVQTIDAASMTLVAGADGVSNGVNIQAPFQNIHVAGDLVMAGGGSASGASQGGSARLGGPGGASLAPTNLNLDVGGNVTLTGGSVSTASIGSSTLGGTAANNVMMTVGGNVTLNAGPVGSTRIGATTSQPIGGNITVIAGGNIALNGAPGNGTAIRTTDNVYLQANSIAEATESVIVARALNTNTVGDALLSGQNQISTFGAFSSVGGDVVLNNSAADLTVTGVSSVGNGSLTINQTGNLAFTAGAFTGTQSIAATGDIVLDVNAALVPNVHLSAGGSQTIVAGGTLTLTGGAIGSDAFARLSASGDQSITAAGISMTGGSSAGSNNQAEIWQSSGAGTQTITITDGDTLALQGGTGGTNNFARIRNQGSTQQIGFTAGGALTLTGGSGVANDYAQITANNGSQTISGLPSIMLTGGTNGTADAGNRAQIRAVGVQTIHASELAMTAGPSGASNNVSVQAPTQSIAVAGDLTMTGGGSVSGLNQGSSARIGGLGGTSLTATNLTLDVGGNATLTGGTIPNAGSSIGSGTLGGTAPSNVTMTVGGDLTLNPGTGSGVRIGATSGAPEGGDISIVTGGNIVMNGAPGARSAIRTTDTVTLTANAITQVADSQIVAGALTTHSVNGASLVGDNELANYHATNSAAGDLTLFNTSPLLTVNGIDQVPTGTLTIAQSGAPGDLILKGTISSGPQTITATGDITVMPASPALLQAFGSQSINAGGALVVQGKADGTDSYAKITSSGDQTIGAASLILSGGDGSGNYAEISSPMQSVAITGDVVIQGGSADNSGARIGGLGGAGATPTNLYLSAGGNVTLAGGTSGAAIGSDTGGGQTTNIAINAGGGVSLSGGAGGGEARIGSPSANVAGGTVTVNSVGSIQLGSGAAIQTTEAVTLAATGTGSTITQEPGATIQANELTASSDSGVTLAGDNQVTSVTIESTGGGDLVFLSPVTGAGDLAFVTGGAIVVDDASMVAGGSIRLEGSRVEVKGVTNGAIVQAAGGVDIDVTGELRVQSYAPAGSVGGAAAIVAQGTASGEPPNLQGLHKTLGVGLLDRIAGHGSVDINAGSVVLQGGDGLMSYALLTGGPIAVNSAGDIRVQGGGGLGAAAWMLSSQSIDLTVGGQLILNSGSGPLSFARLQTVHPLYPINVHFPNLATGGYLVNGEPGYRDGLSGFFAGPAAAKPGKQLEITYGQ